MSGKTKAGRDARSGREGAPKLFFPRARFPCNTHGKRDLIMLAHILIHILRAVWGS